VLAELERDLADLERRCADQRQASEVETQAAGDWERRAMSAVQDGRDDVAREALNQLRNHLDTAKQLATEASELEVLRDSYRNAVKAVRVTSVGAATA
jgi:phage shock protein A